MQYCWDNHIFPHTLPPHSSHFLQPLDVTIFQQFKHYHRLAMDKSLRHGVFNFNKIEFIAAFENMWKKTFKPTTIISGWKKAGLFPLDLNKVLELFIKRKIKRGTVSGTELEMLRQIQGAEYDPRNAAHRQKLFGQSTAQPFDEGNNWGSNIDKETREWRELAGGTESPPRTPVKRRRDDPKRALDEWPSPRHFWELEGQAEWFRDRLEEIDGVSSPFRKRFKRFTNSAISRALCGKEAEETLKEV